MRMLAALLCLIPSLCLAETVVEVASPRGVTVRALEEVPPHPKGSVILLAGGSGMLELQPDGSMGALRGNQLVRSRQGYAQAGYATLVPDMGPGLGNARGYRNSAEHAQDLGALVQHMRSLAAPVVVVGTSRGTLSAATLAGHSEGTARPDAIVLTSAFLAMSAEDSAVNFSGGPQAFTMPVLLVGHESDACRETPASNIEAFRQWLTASPRVDVKIFSGGTGATGKTDQCGANSAHGYLGLDDQVVAAITDWIASLPH